MSRRFPFIRGAGKRLIEGLENNLRRLMRADSKGDVEGGACSTSRPLQRPAHCMCEFEFELLSGLFALVSFGLTDCASLR
jgi:hypothetical protein